MMDAYSRRLLAVYLTFDPPSYRSLMMVVRICVQRFERLPQSLVVDGGREFHGLYFFNFFGPYSSSTKTPRLCQPQFWSCCAPVFIRHTHQIIYNLPVLIHAH